MFRFTTRRGSLYQLTSLADVCFHIVVSIYVRFRYSAKNQMRFAVFWRISLRFSDPLYAPLLQLNGRWARLGYLQGSLLAFCQIKFAGTYSYTWVERRPES